jgi:hypothetical protein
MAASKHIFYAEPKAIRYWLELIIPVLQERADLDGKALEDTAVALTDKIITALVGGAGRA